MKRGSKRNKKRDGWMSTGRGRRMWKKIKGGGKPAGGATKEERNEWW